jgi:hypothetical protein
MNAGKSKRVLWLFVFAAAVIWISGCNRWSSVIPPDSSPEGALTTDRALYGPGSDVRLNLRNIFGEQIGYNLCTSQLERESAGQWINVREDRICTMELRTLRAGETAAYTLQLPGSLSSGTYRYLARIDMIGESGAENDSMSTAISNTFRVEQSAD